MVYLTAPGEMSIEPCPKPIYDWTNELGKYLPPGVDLVTTYAEALITVVWSAAQGFPHHDMNEYISNLESLN